MKAGRYTAALLLIAVGTMLILDQWKGTNTIVLLLKWWPLLLVILGVEFLLLNQASQREQKRLRIDLWSIFCSVLIAAIVIGVTQAPSVKSYLADRIDINLGGLLDNDEGGMRFDKGLTGIPLQSNTKAVHIQNPYGNVTMTTGDVERIEVSAVVIISGLTDEKAEQIAERSRITFEQGSTLHLNVEGEEVRRFLWKSKPRMDLTVTLPADRELGLKLSIANGSVIASSLIGSVEIETALGSIEVKHSRGDLKLETVNGAISVEDIIGKVTLSTVNGRLQAEGVEGSVKAHSVNGKVQIVDASEQIDAETVNGDIDILSGVIGGHWQVKSVMGKAILHLPEDGNFAIDGKASLGKINTDFPFSLNEDKIEGTAGNGTHTIKISTPMGITLKKNI